MHAVRFLLGALTLGPVGLVGCTGGAGSDGSEILVPFDAIHGGMIFSTRQINGASGYDLWWVPVPAAPTVLPQPVARVTDATGDEWQPSVSRSGNAIVFSKRDRGIFLISESGRVKQISDTKGTPFKDSLPAVSPDGTRVAWVRENFDMPIGDTGFVETVIMLANFDGEEIRALNPKTSVIQDAPTFDPAPTSTRLAWSEFNVETLTPNGPQDYGIWIHDFQTGNGNFICQSPEVLIRGLAFRCFGQHLVWPVNGALVLPQQFLEIFVDGSPPSSIYPEVIESLTTQQLGVPETGLGNQGFFSAFPISASYLDRQRLIFDGIVSSVEGDNPTLGFFISQVDGGGIYRLNVQNYFSDFDPGSTANFFFSVATPQLIP